MELHDICDEMAGEYDKSFKWTGWHPQCRCVMTPIVMTPAEFAAYLKNKHDAEATTSEKGKGELPEQLGEWVKKNADRVAEAWAKGKLPKWLQENLDAIQEAGIMPVVEQAATETTAEQQPAKAAKRVKTEEEKAAIREAWLKRNRLRRFRALDENNKRRFLLNVSTMKKTTMQNVVDASEAIRKAYGELENVIYWNTEFWQHKYSVAMPKSITYPFLKQSNTVKKI